MNLGASGGHAGSPDGGHDSPSGASSRGSHQLAAVMVCPRMWAHRYYQGWRPKADKPYRMGGTLIHVCMAYHFAARMPEDQRPAWFGKRSRNEDLERTGRGFPALIAMAKANYEKYVEDMSDLDDQLTPRYIEEEFKATVGELDPGGPLPELDNEVVTCRTDLVYENTKGLWILDYKSFGASKVRNDGYLTRWNPEGEFSMNWQININLHILRKRLGPRVRGFLIQRTTRQEPYDTDRHVCEVAPIAYADTPRWIRHIVSQELGWRRRLDAGEKARQHLWACWGRYGSCDYWPVCTAAGEPEQRLLLERDFARQDGR